MANRSHFFENLVREYEPRVRKFVSTSITNQSNLEDVVQEVFITAWKKIDLLSTFDERAIFPWLCGTASRHISNHRRSMHRRERKFHRFGHEKANHEATTRPPDPDSISLDILNALKKLPPDTRIILLLVLWHDAGANEVAIALQCSYAAASKKIQRSMAMLREVYQRDD